MALFGLGSIVPAGLTAVAAGVAGKVVDGCSFAETLLRGDQAAEALESSKQEDEAAKAAQEEFDAKLEDFRKKLSERLASAGIDLSTPLTLQADGFGYITIDGEHPDRTAIEQLLAADPELTGAFNALSADYARSIAGDNALGGDVSSDGDEATPYDRLLSEIDRRGFRVTLHGASLTIDAPTSSAVT